MTAKTITVSFRKSNTAENAAIGASGATATDDAYIADLQTYLPLFNRSYQLYGRKVVLKPYSGQGDWLQEDVGQNLSGAQADAATVKSMGAFADVSHSVYMTVPYATSLAQQHVLAMNTLSLGQATLQRYSPYLWGYAPSEDKIAQWYSNILCRRLKGLPASFAGDPVYQKQTRKFGLAVLDTPNYSEVGGWVTSAAKACGITFAYTVKFTGDVTQQSQEAPTIIARMHSAGVNSLVYYGDYNMLKYMTQQADAQQYNPEWVLDSGGDVGGRGPSANQMAHAIGYGDFFFADLPDKAHSDAYRAYKLANPHGEPQEPFYAMAYYGLVQLFNGLQSAGPSVTPTNFARGIFGLPPSRQGAQGVWAYGSGAYTPTTESRILRFNPNAKSNLDGKAGAWIACDRARFYPFANPAAWGSPRTLTCP